jgi:hypothetical protein
LAEHWVVSLAEKMAVNWAGSKAEPMVVGKVELMADK